MNLSLYKPGVKIRFKTHPDTVFEIKSIQLKPNSDIIDCALVYHSGEKSNWLTIGTLRGTITKGNHTLLINQHKPHLPDWF